MRNRLLKMQTFITRHYIFLTSLLYRVRTLTSHDTEESENSPESLHLGEIKRMRKQCVPGASLLFTRAGDEATTRPEVESLGVQSFVVSYPQGKIQTSLYQS